MPQTVTRTTRYAVVAISALILALLLVPSAPAQTTPIAAGSVDWGIKASFRNYVLVTGHGSITPSGGVTANPDGSYKFPVTGGSFNDLNGETKLELGGSLHLYAHDGVLDITLRELRVVINTEGAYLIGDAESLQLGTGEDASFDDAKIVSLDVTSPSLPQVAAGQTSWPNVATTLHAEGVPIFGNYSLGTAFDPITFSYTGPGGRPFQREFPEAGTAVYEQSAEANAPGAPIRIFFDADNELVHLLTSSAVVALDAQTLDFRGAQSAPEGESFWSNGNAFDPETGTVFTTTGEGVDVLAYSWNPSTAEYARATVPLLAQRSLVYSTASNRLFAIPTADYASWGYSFTPPIAPTPIDAAALTGASTWTDLTYDPIDEPERPIEVAATTDGKLIATLGGLNDSGTFRRKPVVALQDDGASLTPAAISGTTSGPDEPFPAEVGTTFGWHKLLPTPGGGMLVTDLMKFGGFNSLMTLVPSSGSSGFSEQGQRRHLNFVPGSLSTDATNGNLYATNTNALEVLKGGNLSESIDVGSAVSRVTGGENRIYAIKSGELPNRIATWRKLGDVPTVTSSPKNTTVVVEGGKTTAQATFTAAATGSPAPQVNWQRRAPGETWQNLSGATTDSITIPTGAADDGAEYRAVYANAAGGQASAPATLTVLHASVPAPKLRTSKKPKRLKKSDASHRVVVAKLACGQLACTVKAPKSVKFDARGKRFKATIDAPGELAPGASGNLVATVPAKAIKRLAGRTATIRVKLKITIAGTTFTRSVSVRVR